jgi:hypothetical protein
MAEGDDPVARDSIIRTINGTGCEQPGLLALSGFPRRDLYVYGCFAPSSVNFRPARLTGDEPMFVIVTVSPFRSRAVSILNWPTPESD